MLRLLRLITSPPKGPPAATVSSGFAARYNRIRLALTTRQRTPTQHRHRRSSQNCWCCCRRPQPDCPLTVRGGLVAHPSTAGLTIEKHTVPRIAEFAGRGGQPTIIDRRRSGLCAWKTGTLCHLLQSERVCCVGKPIEHRLCADDDAAPELVVDAYLSTAQKLGGLVFLIP